MLSDEPVLPGRLQRAMLARFDRAEFAIPSPGEHARLARWETRWDCHVVTYRAGCPAHSGPRHLCTNAYAARLCERARHELALLERDMPRLVLVAYERPWRFRRPVPA